MASVAIEPAPAKKTKSSRLWWHVHQWVGLKLAIFTAFIFATGTLAVVSHEIDWLFHPSLRVAPTTVTGAPDWGKIAVGAASVPEVKEIRYIAAPTASAFASRVTVQYRDKSLGYVHAHPTTGAVQGQQGFVDAQRILRNLHRHLNLPTKYGVPIVSSLAVLLLISFVTSLVVYKKWWRGFFKPVRFRDARTMWGDVHRLAGVWSLWFVLLIALTGLWYLVESLGGDAPAMPKAKVAKIEASTANLAARLGPAVAAARAAEPTLVVESIRFPDKKNGAFVIEGQKSAWLVRPRANTVWTDAATGKVELRTDARNLNVHQRISEMADPLHFGTFGGYWTKVPWFLFGVALTALSLSGVIIYGLRIARDTRANVAQSNWVLAWAGMGWWRWIAVAAVLTGFVMMLELLIGVAEN